MAGWVVFGLLFAVACVGLAFMFQPEALPDGAAENSKAAGAPSDRVADLGTAPAPGESAGSPLPAESFTPVAPAPEALAGITNVRLRTGAGLADAARDVVAAALAQARIAEVQVETLPFEVASSRVGYYRAEDKAVAEALAAFIAPVLGRAEPLPVRDYGELLDSAEPGRLDLWIGG
jgi:hypothetical protein